MLSPLKSSAELMEKVLGFAHERLADSGLLAEKFIRRYYAGTALEDLAERMPEDVYGAAISHWNFLAQRQPGEAKVRVYNPDVEQHGWASTHTIIEIVTDDMPFLVDSVRMALNERGLTIHLLIHPVMSIRRDGDGRAARSKGDASSEGGADNAGAVVSEAVMHIEVDRQTDKAVISGIVADVEKVLNEVRATVEDWQPMRRKLAAILEELEQSPPPLSADEIAEAKAFLQWMDANHFTLLGYREYKLGVHRGEEGLRRVAGSGLGLLRDNGRAKWSKGFSNLPASVRDLGKERRLLIITKTNGRSRIHRPGYKDYVGIKEFGADGEVIGERRFIGLYTSAAYNRVPRAIPLLREKVARIMALSAYPDNSHAGKALQNILDTFPRDELFQIPESELYETAIGILHLQERQRIRLFIHRDRYRRFFFCLVYVPRDRFSTQTRRAMQEILEQALGALESTFNVQLSESALARLHFVLRVAPDVEPEYDVKELEERLRQTTRVWSDELNESLLEQFGEERGVSLFRRYGEAFRADYREHYSARIAVHDVAKMETLGEAEGSLGMSLYHPLEAPEHTLQFKLFHVGRALSLSDVLPMLENMGLRVENERPSKIKRADGPRVWLHDLETAYAGDNEHDLGEIKEKFQEAFARLWSGEVENDGFNRLVIGANLEWRDIVILRAYCKYLRQAGVTFSQSYMEDTFARNPAIARLLVALFTRRFSPRAGRDHGRGEEQIVEDIEIALDAVSNLDEDRILRSFLGVVRATLRTNYYTDGENGAPKSYVAFKFDPHAIPELPDPRPMFEVFVYSPRVEGVHLRGGPVARGGIRWSDRREDFRTEVLGLVKAQMVKNAVIVPVGSKGGFVAKALSTSAGRDEAMREGIACYQTFMRGLLDVTDNLAGGEVVPPKDVERHDGDDPYLVVAADKGTASFSDIANAIACDYGYWLGDAFASGGSVGYDHKGMGITARGAWESVKRHFRELGTDIQKSEFTVVGIGDMSGDVFGNGMLLSEHIKLIGAFNHLHVFLDPDPDAGVSFAERKRLFELPRSTWDDYDESLISAGGGVYSRSAKSIPLSDQVRRLLGVQAKALAPNALIQALLTAPVDLLWNGGIGTYVKASNETHAEVGDRANDAVRVDATTLRCKVVGEGGNLGLTQRSRIEYALAGGRINTDAIDNSAGVDCSDHEVNIKILLNQVVANGDMTAKQRERLLAQMTDDVAELVLRNNYLQTQALSVATLQAGAMLDVHARLIRQLERDGLLHREIEFLPDEESIEQRKLVGGGLTAPELSVLLAYVKITLFDELLHAEFTGDEFLHAELVSYFPPVLKARFEPLMSSHRLWREIICTQVANEIVNRVGVSFCFRIREETGFACADVARAYLVASVVFDMQAVWVAIEALDNEVAAHVQLEMMLETRKLVERASRWLLRHRTPGFAIGPAIEFFEPGVTRVAQMLETVVAPTMQAQMGEKAQALRAAGVAEPLAKRVAGHGELFAALDLVEVSRAHEVSIEEAAKVYFALSTELDLQWLRDQVFGLQRADRWQTLARAALRDDVYNQQRRLTADILSSTPADADTHTRVQMWIEQNTHAVERCRQVVDDLKAHGQSDFTMLSVAMREIKSLILRTDDDQSAQDRTPKAEGRSATGRRQIAKSQDAEAINEQTADL